MNVGELKAFLEPLADDVEVVHVDSDYDADSAVADVEVFWRGRMRLTRAAYTWNKPVTVAASVLDYASGLTGPTRVVYETVEVPEHVNEYNAEWHSAETALESARTNKGLYGNVTYEVLSVEGPFQRVRISQ